MTLIFLIKGALSGLRDFLAIERPLKMMKNAFYFTLKALFVLKVFKFLSWLFSYVENGVSLCIQSEWGKMRTRITLITHAFYAVNCNMHIAQYLKKYRQSNNEI